MHTHLSLRARTACAAVLAALILVHPSAAVAGEPRTAVQGALHERKVLHQRIEALRGLRAARRVVLRARPSLAETVLARHGSDFEAVALDRLQISSRRALVRRDRGLADFDRRVRRRIGAIRDERAQIAWWLATYGVFRACPVPDATVIHDDFGTTVRLPGVPPHRHQGSDVEAPTWSPILAPFDGYASGSRSHLGGLEVRVRGSAGYVYNAHLAGLGRLGWVSVGDVVGYVGATGDATGPHDHFEWHPWNNVATDPYALLVAACVPV